MGACASTPERCVRVRKKKTRKRRKAIKRRFSSRLSDGSVDRISAPDDHRSSFTNSTFQGSVETAWFDSVAIFESDCEEDFESFPDEVLSLNGFDFVLASSITSSREANHCDWNVNMHHKSSTSQMQKVGDLSAVSSVRNSVSNVARFSDNQNHINSQSKSDVSSDEAKQPVFLDEISSSIDGNSGKDQG